MGGLIIILLLILLLWLLAAKFINKSMLTSSCAVNATPSSLSSTTRSTIVNITVEIDKTSKKPTTIKGKIWEHDTFSPNDHLSNFTLIIPAGDKIGYTTTTLTVKANSNGDEELWGNTTDYSQVEDEWDIFAEVEGNSPVLGSTSNSTTIKWAK